MDDTVYKLQKRVEQYSTCLLYTSQPFEIISDIGSGIDYKKKGLQESIRRISQNQVEKVVVLYKDRLLSFGFELDVYKRQTLTISKSLNVTKFQIITENTNQFAQRFNPVSYTHLKTGYI